MMLYDPSLSNHVPRYPNDFWLPKCIRNCQNVTGAGRGRCHQIGKCRGREVDKSLRGICILICRLKKITELNNCFCSFVLFFSKCVTVSNASGSRSCFIILHHAAYVKSCEDIYIYICEDVRTPRSFQKNRFRNKTSSNQKNILHTQFMEAKTDQKCWSRYRPPEETNHMNHSHQLQVQLEQIKKDALCSERIWYNRY